MANQGENYKLIEEYFSAISDKYQTGQAREHAYRPVFETLIKSLDPTIKVINDPSRSEHGNPDFVFLRGDITVGYTETKDIGLNLDKTQKTNQMERYLGYSNLILTDYLEFRFFKNGVKYGEDIKIGKIVGDKLSAETKNFGELADALSDFLKGEPENIKSGKRLAEIMGGKARRIRDNIRHFLASESNKNTELIKVYETIKKLLVHDLSPDTFADMYAQTLVYGLFVARYHDETQKDFSRQEARDLVPASNPFLRHFFDHIVGPDFDKRLEYIVDELCVVFSHANVQELVHQYFKKNDLWGNVHEGPDPVIHFYEDFLKEYDPNLRKKLGAYYTPLPIVRFIVKSVDEILKKEFGLSNGLANSSKITTQHGEVHRVQVLDPAVGTGTFISEVIHKIYSYFSDQKGRWASYIHYDLLPRLHGFELMMAPYTIAHLKMSMNLKETGFRYFNNTRLGIYLTNSLEEGNKQDVLLSSFGLAESITEEGKAAADIKNNKPIMVVVGNPPYSGESSNASYSGNDVYKKEPGGGKLKERNPKWLNDDYVKFIRFAESMIEKTGEGVVAMITAHGYIDNPTFRGIRYHLMQTFDEIYVLDLHGNANKKEVAPDGSEDKNVFDIKTGVAIFIGIKKGSNNKDGLAKVYKSDLFGNRHVKFDYLSSNSSASVKWKEIKPSTPNYEWIERDEELFKTYQEGFSLTELFSINSVGIVTSRDRMSIQFEKSEIEKVVNDFQTIDIETLRSKYNLGKDVQDWKVEWAKNDVIKNFSEDKIIPISYRPFDDRWTFYTGTSRGFMVRPRSEVMQHMTKNNLALVALRQVKAGDSFQHIFVSRNIVESTLISNKTSEIDYVFPLYANSPMGNQISSITPNLNQDIVKKICKINPSADFINIFDYVYAVLYSPSYREKFKGFLKKDFPRIPYPKDKKMFEDLSALGKELRHLHLMEESPKLGDLITTFPEPDSDEVESKHPKYERGNVYINKTQYFGNVPEVAWNFYIGGYQPAQKYLKDRQGRKLTNSEIEHYQKIIVALIETDRIMKEINKVYEI